MDGSGVWWQLSRTAGDMSVVYRWVYERNQYVKDDEAQRV